MLVMNQIEHLLEQNNSELDASDGLVEQASWNLLETGLHSECTLSVATGLQENACKFKLISFHMTRSAGTN